jgi:hypothetical protein
MATATGLVSLALMTLFGLATAAFLAYMVRDLVRTVAGGPAEDATRIAMIGPVVYLAGFLTVLGGVLFGWGSIAGVDTVTVGVAVIVLASVPMGVGLYLAARQAGTL